MEHAHERVLSEEELEFLRAQADSGSTERILSPLREMDPEAFQMTLARLRCEEYRTNTVGRVLDECPHLDTILLEHMVALWLYDPGTFFHSVRTYELVTHVLTKDTSLAEMVTSEKVTFDHLQRSALLHDIGKLCIPRNILCNKLPHAEAIELLRTALTKGDEKTLRMFKEKCNIVPEPTTLEETLDRCNVRPIHVLPVTSFLQNTDIQNLLVRGFTVEHASLMDIINQHEAHTRRMLVATHPVESEVAGHHHSPEKSAYQNSAHLLGMTSRLASELMMALDEVDALSHPRVYRNDGSLALGLLEVVHTTERGRISDFIAFHVVATLIKDIALIDAEEHSEAVHALESYLREHGPMSESLPKY